MFSSVADKGAVGDRNGNAAVLNHDSSTTRGRTETICALVIAVGNGEVVEGYVAAGDVENAAGIAATNGDGHCAADG